ncbi:MAG: hypothetical protein O8C61_01855 [Candidatus Methanoperedens sp.]|nr:hypothetical protein [Candidatus Methanoperedens sp.]
MIFLGKTIQSIADENIYPFLNNLLQSEEDAVVIETLRNISILADMGVERKYFPGLQKVLYHKNIGIARNSLDFLREMSPGLVKGIELKNDIWKSMYPFFCVQASSSSLIAIDSLKILDTFLDYGIVGDYKNLQKALLHKNDKVAQLTLDVLRRIKGLTNEAKVERVEPGGVESRKQKVEKVPQKVYQPIKEKLLEEPVQRREELQNRIIDVLNKNPSYVEDLKKIKSKYRI